MRRRRTGPALLFLALFPLAIASSGHRLEAATLPYVMNFPCAGTYWLSLPNHSVFPAAEDLCAAIPNAVQVTQMFPMEAAGASARQWTYDCISQACTPSPGTSSPTEPGCSLSSCFCVGPGEGFEVTVSAPSTFQIEGCETRDPIVLPAGGRSYLVSVPFQTNLVTWNDLALATGLPSTGFSRGTMARRDGCAGTVSPAVQAGSPQAMSLLLAPGEAYRLTYTNTLGHTWTNPTSSTVTVCDADGDGTPDDSDPCTDTDGDGYGNPGYPANTCPQDNCPNIANPGQEDTDGDGVADACDNCPAVSNSSQKDADHDGPGDACDLCTDTDGDGFGNPGFPPNTCPSDNCPAMANPSQGDTDHDGVGDVCDNCPNMPNVSQADADQDGPGDACDTCTDTDGDGYGNPGFPSNTCPLDNCPSWPVVDPYDGDFDGAGDVCDNCPGVYNPDQADSDRDGMGDACDACIGGGSLNVATVIAAPIFPMDHELPTSGIGPTGSFDVYNFFALAPANVSAAALAPGGVCGASGCDTVVLTLVDGPWCNLINLLTPSARADLVSFVGTGKKLIIYDSECGVQDFSWLPFPMTISSAGETEGHGGALTIVEENALSSSSPTSRRFIDSSLLLASEYSFVFDSNVLLTTSDPGWCIDMSATNGLGVTGAVHSYARYPAGSDAGVIIYNGLDIDFDPAAPPDSATISGNVAKLWLQELQQPMSPTCLSCGFPVTGVSLTPATDRNPLGATHVVLARITNVSGVPQPGIPVTFSVVTGPNAGAVGACSPNVNCTTNPNGEVSFAYTGTGGVGIDHIQACYLDQTAQQRCSQVVSKEWVDCNDGNPCTDDSFNQNTGLCVHTVNAVCTGKVTGGGEINVPGGTANFGFVAQRKTAGGSITGNLEYNNHARNLNVHTTSPASILTLSVSPTTATFTGACTKRIGNGSPVACTFSVTVEDNGEPGTNDKFTIAVSGEPIEGGPAPILHGNIQIHVP
jgi:hypothetical protein